MKKTIASAARRIILRKNVRITSKEFEEFKRSRTPEEMNTQGQKTKEEILEECSTDTTTKGRVRWNDAIKAMDSYASHLSERVKELEEEVESTKKKHNERMATYVSDAAKNISGLEARIKELEAQQPTGKSLQECKDEVAKRNGFKDWEDLSLNYSRLDRLIPIDVIDEYAIEYASQFRTTPVQEGQYAMDFFIWLVRVAKIEVIDAVEAIEAQGFQDQVSKLVPVMTLKELYDKWAEEKVKSV